MSITTRSGTPANMPGAKPQHYRLIDRLHDGPVFVQVHGDLELGVTGSNPGVGHELLAEMLVFPNVGVNIDDHSGRRLAPWGQSPRFARFMNQRSARFERARNAVTVPLRSLYSQRTPYFW